MKLVHSLLPLTIAILTVVAVKFDIIWLVFLSGGLAGYLGMMIWLFFGAAQTGLEKQ